MIILHFVKPVLCMKVMIYYVLFKSKDAHQITLWCLEKSPWSQFSHL